MFANIFGFPQLSNYVKQYPRLVAILNAGPLKYIKFVVLKLYVIVFMGYCLGPFVLLKLHRYIANFLFAYPYFVLIMISLIQVISINSVRGFIVQKRLMHCHISGGGSSTTLCSSLDMSCLLGGLCMLLL